MPTRQEIATLLHEHRDVLRERFKVDKIGLFGSYVRGEERAESDIDLLVRFHAPIGWEFIDLKEYLEKILGRQVDLVTEAALKPLLKETILSEVVYQ